MLIDTDGSINIINDNSYIKNSSQILRQTQKQKKNHIYTTPLETISYNSLFTYIDNPDSAFNTVAFTNGNSLICEESAPTVLKTVTAENAISLQKIEVKRLCQAFLNKKLKMKCLYKKKTALKRRLDNVSRNLKTIFRAEQIEHLNEYKSFAWSTNKHFVTV